jgi:hypothetical protein
MFILCFGSWGAQTIHYFDWLRVHSMPNSISMVH